MTKAFSNITNVIETADHFFFVADALHKRLNSRSLKPGNGEPSDALYGLLIEEYGLRTRAGILRNSAKAHLINNANTNHSDLLQLLRSSAETIGKINDLLQLTRLTTTISTLCVSINPGKGHVVDFLVNELQGDLAHLTSALEG